MRLRPGRENPRTSARAREGGVRGRGGGQGGVCVRIRTGTNAHGRARARGGRGASASGQRPAIRAGAAGCSVGRTLCTGPIAGRTYLQGPAALDRPLQALPLLVLTLNLAARSTAGLAAAVNAGVREAAVADTRAQMRIAYSLGRGRARAGIAAGLGRRDGAAPAAHRGGPKPALSSARPRGRGAPRPPSRASLPRGVGGWVRSPLCRPRRLVWRLLPFPRRHLPPATVPLRAPPSRGARATDCRRSRTLRAVGIAAAQLALAVRFFHGESRVGHLDLPRDYCRSQIRKNYPTGEPYIYQVEFAPAAPGGSHRAGERQQILDKPEI